MRQRIVAIIARVAVRCGPKRVSETPLHHASSADEHHVVIEPVSDSHILEETIACPCGIYRFVSIQCNGSHALRQRLICVPAIERIAIAISRIFRKINDCALNLNNRLKRTTTVCLKREFIIGQNVAASYRKLSSVSS